MGTELSAKAGRGFRRAVENPKERVCVSGMGGLLPDKNNYLLDPSVEPRKLTEWVTSITDGGCLCRGAEQKSQRSC